MEAKEPSIVALSYLNYFDKRSECAAKYGMKATNLGILLNQGYNVPNGFIVTPEWDARKDQGLLEEFYERLNAKSVSARSSATCEDSRGASFAGMFKSFMPTTLETLPEYIEKCRESIENDDALLYMKHNKIDPKNVKMNVLVQEFIEAKFAGVIYTRTPCNKGFASCDTIYAQGEKAVSGEETVIITTIKIPELRIVNMRNCEIATEGANPKYDIYNSRIIETAFKIEKLFNYPQDIEFTVGKDGKTYILQSRDITALDKETLESWKPLTI